MITTRAQLASYLDQTNLTLGATCGELETFLEVAVDTGFRAVCVLPNMTSLARRITAGTATRLATVVSFPLGSDVPAVKVAETRHLLDLGTDEIDVVIDIAHARMGHEDAISAEVSAVRSLLVEEQLLKVIIEMPLLTNEQAVAAARAAERGGAHIVKTSTGFKGLKLRGTTPEDVRLLRSVLRPETGIKAAGGIRTTEQALALIEEGATRIGTSSGLAILEGFLERGPGDHALPASPHPVAA
ncbi:MAG TPA: deoxyribose-phosphate aldolase [Solirubrobacteraceae bacterium]|nr:deoxyribose-phosphate aldolase [Solirubrobacteraceae bacterium]